MAVLSIDMGAGLLSSFTHVVGLSASVRQEIQLVFSPQEKWEKNGKKTK